MGAIAHVDGHDRLGSIDELVPSLAAVVDDDVKTRFDSQLDTSKNAVLTAD
jgi:hypothetical protein